jgi:hypothetical protein
MSVQLADKQVQLPTAQSTAPARGGRLGRVWHRIHLGLQDMSYGARRAVEVQAPWSVDSQWHTR